MLKDKRAIVTGASQGLGEAIAERLIQEGCRIILTDIQEVQTKEKTAKWKKQYGDVFLNMKCDVTHEPDVEAVLALSEKSWGGVDIFVANAGILISGPIIDFDTARWRQVIDVNLVGQMICMKHALRAMERAKSGSYIQINSKSGKKGSFRNSAYAASKFGGIGLVQSTALEMADKGIRVNAICPGNMLDSPLWVNNLYKQYAKNQDITEAEVRKKYINEVPMKRGCSYYDVCNAVVFLASDQSSYMTGQAINVTGGQEMR